MATRRVLTGLKLDKIAAVDDPCVAHATVAIMKRRQGSPDLTTPSAIAKATFGEALSACMTADAVNEAFYESFDGLWERNEAFKTALTDELSAGGDGTAASDDYVASVKALVDDAVAEARKAGVSATDTGAIDKALSTAVDNWLETRPKEHTTMKITDRAGLLAAVSSFSLAKATYQDVDDIKAAAKALDAEDVLPAEGPLAKAAPDPQIAKMAREIAVLKLSPEIRKHFDGLDESGQTAFLAKSETDQAADVEKANATDPVVFECKDGTEIRKSDGAAAALLAKRNDELSDRLAKVEGGHAAVSIEKRAVEEFPNVAKATAVDMLKTVEKLGAESESGKAVLKTLTTMQNSGQRLFKTLGSVEDEGEGEGGIAKARTTFDGKVAEIASRDKIGKADAMSKARVEFPDLAKEAFPDTFQAVEDREVDQATAR